MAPTLTPTGRPQQTTAGPSEEVLVQNDLTYIAIIFALFGLMFALVNGCDRIIGSDEEAMADDGGHERAAAHDDTEVAA